MAIQLNNIQDLAESDEDGYGFPLSVTKTGIIVEGNLYYNNALRPNISFNNKEYHQIYKEKTGLTSEEPPINILDIDNKSQTDSDIKYNSIGHSQINGISTVYIKRNNDKHHDSNKSINIIHASPMQQTDEEEDEEYQLEQNRGQFINEEMDDISLDIENIRNETDNYYLIPSHIINCIDFIVFINDIGILIGDIGLLFLYDTNKFEDENYIFWFIYFLNGGIDLICSILRICIFFLRFCGSLCFDQCSCCYSCMSMDNDCCIKRQKLKNRLQNVIDIGQYGLFLYFCNFTLESIIFYAPLILFAMITILGEKELECNDTKPIYKVPYGFTDQLYHKNSYELFKTLIIGLQTIPFLYYDKTSTYFRTLWFKLCVIIVIWYQHKLIKFIDIMIINVLNNIICREIMIKYDKLLGESINKYELRKFNLNCKSLKRKMKRNVKIGRLLMVRVLVGSVISIGWTLFIVVLNIIYIETIGVSSNVQPLYSMIHIIIPCLIFCCRGLHYIIICCCK